MASGCTDAALRGERRRYRQYCCACACAMRCGEVRCSAVRCGAVQLAAARWGGQSWLRRNAMRRNTTRHNTKPAWQFTYEGQFAGPGRSAVVNAQVLPGTGPRHRGLEPCATSKASNLS